MAEVVVNKRVVNLTIAQLRETLKTLEEAKPHFDEKADLSFVFGKGADIASAMRGLLEFSSAVKAELSIRAAEQELGAESQKTKRNRKRHAAE